MIDKLVSFSPSMEYAGYVTLTVVSADGKIKSIRRYNQGTDFLFNFLSKSLCGIDVSNDAPNYMSIVKSDGTVISARRAISDKQPVDKTDLGWCAVFRCAFPKNSINTGSLGSGTLLVKLISRDETNDMAVVEINADVLSNLLPGTTLYIEWTMQIANKQSTASAS